MSENESPRPTESIDPNDIHASEVPRRSFLRGFGVLAGTAALTGMAAACELPTASDECITGDPIGSASDTDPSDPSRSDSDTSHCDTD